MADNRRFQDVIRLWQDAKTELSTVLTTWQDLADYMVPKRENRVLREKPVEGTKQGEKIFDSTAPDAIMKLSAFMATVMTNQAVRWFSLLMEPLALNDNVEARKWADETATLMFSLFNSSNFNSEIQEVYQDLVAFGTAALLLEKRIRPDGTFEGYQWRAEPIGTYAIMEGPDGMVDTVFRRLDMNWQSIVKRWGIEALPESFRKQAMQKPLDKTEVLHAVFPRNTPGVKKGAIATEKPWVSLYLLLTAQGIPGNPEGHPLHEGGFDEMPWFVVRWTKASYEKYGRGPGHNAYPDVRTLNKAMEITFRAWGKLIDPPINVLDDTVVGRVSTLPAALNIVTDLDGVKPWPVAGRFDVNNVLLQDIRTSIRRAFFADQLQLPDRTIITATEVERRLELMQQVLGPTLGRLERELLSPLIDRAFSILDREDLLPPLPPVLQDALEQTGGTLSLSVKYEGSLARSQRASNLGALERFLTFTANAATIEPRVVQNIDWDETIRQVGRDVNVPARVLKSKTRVRDERDQRAQAQTAAAQAEAQNVGADTASKVANAAKSLSQAGIDPRSAAGLPDAQATAVETA